MGVFWRWSNAVCLACVLFLTAPVPGRTEDRTSAKRGDTPALSESEIQAIEHGHRNSAGYALARLGRLYKADGKAALEPAVPALVRRAEKILRMPPVTSEGEGEGELLIEIIGFLSRAGDERAKSVLLEVMTSDRVGVPGAVARGLTNLGPSVIPEVVDSLKRGRISARWKTAFTLAEMAEMAPSFFTEEDRAEIRKCLIAYLQEERGLKVSFIKALGAFGDASTVPVLEEMATQDPYTSSTGRYMNRVAAEAALKRLKAALQKLPSAGEKGGL